MILYRPVGLKELELIMVSNYQAYPPRLPHQPIFYPVLNEDYAVQIAREWNAVSPPDYAGFVTRFELDQAYADTFVIQTVGNQTHQELWVPSEELAEFNRHILGSIEIIEKFYGEGFTHALDPVTNLPVFP